jgi:hypothetical protein
MTQAKLSHPIGITNGWWPRNFRGLHLRALKDKSTSRENLSLWNWLLAVSCSSYSWNRDYKEESSRPRAIPVPFPSNISKWQNRHEFWNILNNFESLHWILGLPFTTYWKRSFPTLSVGKGINNVSIFNQRTSGNFLRSTTTSDSVGVAFVRITSYTHPSMNDSNFFNSDWINNYNFSCFTLKDEPFNIISSLSCTKILVLLDKLSLFWDGYPELECLKPS